MRKILISILLILCLTDIIAQQARFVINQPSKCVPSTVTFVNTSTGNPMSYQWVFGDGFTSATPDPTHPYTNQGKYTVQLIVSYPNNVFDTAVQTVEVLKLPSFTFTKLNDSVCPGGSVSFTSSVSYPASSNGIQSYSWDFGDGGLGATANPSHQYINTPNQPVLYHVSLMITDTNGCSQKVTQSNYIYVKAKPIPEFTVDKQYFCIPDTPGIVQFTNQTSATTNNTYSWIISDGRQSSLENPVFSFSNIGNYAVSLTATSPEGCSNTISKSGMVEVIDLKIQTTVSDTILCSVPNDVTFKGSLASNILYTWSFGDGGTGTSSFNPITHTYTASGTYKATVIANYRNGACFAYDTIPIHVYDSIHAQMRITKNPLCDFEYDLPILFENVTPYPVPDDFGFGSTTWLFGDSISLTGDSVYHVYSSDTDIYNVTMQTITPYGCVLEDISGGVWFHSYIPINMRLDKIGDCVPATFTAAVFKQDTWDIPAAGFVWDWGDGSPLDTTHINNNPSHTYTDTGVYEVYLTFVNAIGCTYTVLFGTAKVGMPPVVWFKYDYQEQCYHDFTTKSPLFVQAFDSLNKNNEPVAGTYANRWLWLDRGKNPMWLAEIDTAFLWADDTGYIRISVVPYHNECPGDTVTIDSVSYACPPRAGFINRDDDPSTLYTIFCDYPAELDLQNLSNGATAYRWFFGDETNLKDQSTSTDTTPVFAYQHSTPFLFEHGVDPLVIRLVAYNADSVNVNSPTYNRCKFCTDTVTWQVYIPDAIMNFTHSPDVCQGNAVYFYDSSNYNFDPFFTYYFTLYPGNVADGEHGRIHPGLGDINSDADTLQKGYSLVFKNLNTYTAILTVVDYYECVHYDTLSFNIYPQSVAAMTSSRDGIHFSDKTDTLCANNNLDTIYYKDASYTNSPFDTAEIVQWRWTKRDDTSYLQNPAFKENTVGMHDLTLRIVNEYGCITDSVFKEKILVNEIEAAFAPLKQTYCNHTDAEFDNRSYILPLDYNKNTKLISTWDFGDGSTYTQEEIGIVYHTYHLSNVPATVTVKLTVSTENGDCSDTYISSINIVGPKASFTDEGHRFPCPEQGQKVQFHSTSSGNPVWYYWQFGDSISGTANESNLKDPIHDYLRTGSYDIIHIIRDGAGCMDSVLFPKHVFVDGPIGSFQYGELSGCIDHRVAFIPSIQHADSIIINPDRASPMEAGGGTINDTLFHSYQIPGAYLPYFYLIKWTDDNGTLKRCVVQWEAIDTIYAIDLIPDFETDSLYCSFSSVLFPNKTTFLPAHLNLDSATWLFGNGDSLHAIDGYTHYDSIGTYPVEMTAYIMGCNKQITKSIDIIELVEEMSLSPDTVSACQNDINIVFAADSNIYIDLALYKWIFDDGDTVDGNPVTKTFGSSGIYPYQLVVSMGMSNCTKTYFDTIIVNANSFPDAEFEANPQTVYYGETMQFTDKSSSGNGAITGWYWDFGDTTNSDQQNPSHTYINTSGYFTVLLEVEDEFGCKDTVTHEVLVLENLNFPNLFTPAGLDGKKYVFKPLEEEGYFKEFELNIYNRWGSLIWKNSCEDPVCPDYSTDDFWWDGYNNLGNLVEDGVYYWVVYAMPLSEIKPIIKNGSVTVIRKK
ncbi:MAG: PKD domain-containing protein [Bacteroidales bacterium]|jgi:PKD repeat protein|nr:PKD domain-containing protein [Bacteroidales bacterium]